MTQTIDYIHFIRENFKTYDNEMNRIKHHTVVNGKVPKNIRSILLYLGDLLAESVFFISQLSDDDRIHYTHHIKSYISVHVDYCISYYKIPLENEFELKFELIFQQDKINGYRGGNGGTDVVQ